MGWRNNDIRVREEVIHSVTGLKGPVRWVEERALQRRGKWVVQILKQSERDKEVRIRR